MAIAQGVPQSFSVIEEGRLEPGIRYLTVDCPDYDAYRTLPAMLTLNGRRYGKAGWSSDKNICCYRTDWISKVAIAS